MPRRPSIPLARSLGRFVGHLKHAISADVSRNRHEIRRETTEETRETPSGTVTLRRTTIEEVELPPAAIRPNPPEQP
ncbi:MAG: hypothetical protein EA380_11350 [Phycisphaeraceae bacterium]|nr:MAG: hypothetical protein EA380_11350 [Phycisphaeraceae bacterium]